MKARRPTIALWTLPLVAMLFAACSANLLLQDVKQKVADAATAGKPAAATPTFSIANGSYWQDQGISISCSTSGSTIYYTLDNTTPTTSSTPYTAPITVVGPVGSKTIKAIATATGKSKSDTATLTVTVNWPSLTIQNSGGGTTNPSGTTTVNPGGPISISATPDGTHSFDYWEIVSGTGITFGDGTGLTAATTISLGASNNGSGASLKAHFKLANQVSTPVIHTAGTFAGDQSVTITEADDYDHIYYTEDGVTTPTSASTEYTGTPIPVTGPSASKTIMAIAVKSSKVDSGIATATITVLYTYTMTMTTAGTGSGNVSPGTETVSHNVATTIIATPDAGSAFTGWTTSGGATVTTPGSATTTAKLTADGTVTANFTLQAPVAPSGLKVTTLSTGDITKDDTRLNISWNASPFATSYVVSRYLTAGNVWVTDPAETSGLSVTDTGLVPGTAYEYQIVAKNAAGTSPSTSFVGKTVPGTALTSITLSTTTTRLFPGMGLTLTPTYAPAGASIKAVTWSSSDATVASVSGGVVTYLKPGSPVTITATSTDNTGLARTCTISLGQLGDIGPAGGYVFYDNGSYTTDSLGHSFRFLECSPAVVNASSDWSAGIVPPVLEGTGIGDGVANSADIINQLGSDAYAANACAAYSHGGKSDWFLPSIGELAEFYAVMQGNAIFTANYYYWSSTVTSDLSNAYFLRFSDGVTSWWDAVNNTQDSIVAIREF